jgi:transcriptional regulator with XRE-family HTH domain
MKRSQAKARTIELLDSIRKMIKSKGITQAKLARDLGVSVPTVKRWLAGEGVDVETLFRLLDYLGLGADGIGHLMASDAGKSFTLTEEQERFFAANPYYLAFLDHLLLQRATPQAIQAKSGINTRSLRSYLRKLEELGLIEVHAGDRIKLLVEGEPVWRRGGPMATAFRDSAMREYLAAYMPRVPLYVFYLDDPTMAVVRQKFADIAEHCRLAEKFARARRAKSKKAMLFMTCEYFEPSFLTRIEDI